MAEAILLHLEYDEGGAREKVIALNVELQKLKKEQASLNQTYKDGIISEEGYAKENQRLKEEISKTTKEIRTNEKSIESNNTVQKTATGSITQLRAQLSLMKAAYADLSEEQRDNSAEGQRQLKSIATLNERLKDLEGAYGDNQRSVGGYAVALEKAIGSNANLIQSIQSYVATAKEAVGGTVDYLKGIKASTEGMAGAQKASVALGLGLKAIGIGLIVQALIGLISFLTKTEAGMEFMAKASAAVGAAFDALIRSFAVIGESLKGFITDLRDGKFLENFTTRINTAKHALDGVTTTMYRAAKAAFDYTRAVQDIERAQRAQAVASALANREAELALKTAEDQTVSITKRQAALKTAYGVQTQALKIEMDNQRRLSEAARGAYIASLDIGEKERKRLQNLSDADFNREIQTRKDGSTEYKEAFLKNTVELYGKETELTLKNMDLIKEQNALRQEAVDKAKQNAELSKQAREALLREEVALLQIRQKQARFFSKESLQIDEELIRKQAELDKLGLKGKYERQLVDLEAARQLSELRIEVAAKETLKIIELRQNLTEYLKKEDSKVTANAREAFKARLDQLSELQERNNRAVVASQLANAKYGSKAELDAKVAAIKQQRDEALKQEGLTQLERKAIIDQANRAISDEQKGYAGNVFNNIVNAAQQATSALSSIFQAQAEIANQVLERQQETALRSAGNNAELRAAIEADFQKRREEMEEKAAKKRKLIARADAAINTAVGATKAFATEGVLGFISGALIIAAGLAQQAIISAQEFADGGIYELRKDGPMVRGAGTGKSDSINARLSNGESVINAKSTSHFAPLLSAINEWGGGKAFKSFAPVQLPQHITHYASGGMMQGGAATEIDYDKLAAAMSRQPAPRIAVDEFRSVENRVSVRESANDH